MKKILIISSIAAVITLAAVSGYLYLGKETHNEEIVATINSESNETKVYPILNIPMENSNMIWCGTFQLAWNELRDSIIKEDIELKDENNLSSQLNKKAFTKEALSKKDYIAMAGYNKDNIVEKINKELKNKFNEGGKWKVTSTLQNPEDILAYSFLKKNIEFKYAFEEIKDGLDFNGSKVKAFGIDDTKNVDAKDIGIRYNLATQGRLLDYKNYDNFILSLRGKNANDEIILAKIPKGDTLENTLNYALYNSNESSGKMALTGEDTIKIPMLTFDIDKHFTEVENKSVRNKGFEDYTIASAIQHIEFSLTEKGAGLKSKAEIAILKGIVISEPKKLIFDKPFLLYMKKIGDDKPYFAIWVDNPEIMIK